MRGRVLAAVRAWRCAGSGGGAGDHRLLSRACGARGTQRTRARLSQIRSSKPTRLVGRVSGGTSTSSRLRSLRVQRMVSTCDQMSCRLHSCSQPRGTWALIHSCPTQLLRSGASSSESQAHAPLLVTPDKVFDRHRRSPPHSPCQRPEPSGPLMYFYSALLTQF